MNAISSWATAASDNFIHSKNQIKFEKKIGDQSFKAYLSQGSLWIVAHLKSGGKTAFRAAFCPDGQLEILKIKKNTEGVDLFLTCSLGDIKITLQFIKKEFTLLRYTTALLPSKPLLFPYSPRDILVLDENDRPEHTSGKIHLGQVGTRSGIIYFHIKKPKAGAVFYFQNLTALADYCQQTETSCKDTVGGLWPELGFALPPTKEKPIKASKEIIINDAFVGFDKSTPTSETGITEQFLNMLAAIYVELPKPETTYKDWPTILNKGLHDLIETPGCWSKEKKGKYFNAYYCDDETPPEIMVQLAILLPLIDYTEWHGKGLPVIETIKQNLPSFYNKKLGTIMRWLPAAEDRLKGEEEQKKPLVMDSWYLHHPLLNLSRLALKGDKKAEKLFLDSLPYAIKVARRFKYDWPVFYKMDTLEVIKAETAEGKGGEKDVAGIYTHILLQAWELTGKKRYLQEAEKAAKTLKGKGFELFYQANNTAFSAGAMLRLWKATGNKTYLNLSYLCIANIMKNVQLWECQYGYAKDYLTFYAIFPLNDAPYTAAYEESEIFTAFNDYLQLAEGEEIMSSVKLMMSEFIRHMINRAHYYYPTMLPKEMLEENPKVGKLDPTLFIALEDLQDGWEKSGTVGQEVYGAGNAFGILPRHYIKIDGEDNMVYVDYPITHIVYENNKKLTFKIIGDARMDCKMMLIIGNKNKLSNYTVFAHTEETPLKGKRTIDNNIEFNVKGDQTITMVFD